MNKHVKDERMTNLLFRNHRHVEEKKIKQQFQD